MLIDSDIYPQFLEHFKSQLLFFEVERNNVRTTYDGGGFQDRHHLMIELVKRSFEDFPSKKKISFWVFTGDNRPANVVNKKPLFSISGPRMHHDFIIPDPHILRWPQCKVNDFHSYVNQIKDISLNSNIKNISFVWRGSLEQNALRKHIHEKYKEHRPNVLDIKDITANNKEDFIEMKELPNWAGMIDFPGIGFSGRLKYILHAIRPTIVFQRLDWDSSTIKLEPGIHYASCNSNFENLIQVSNQILENYPYYLNMAKNTSALICDITQRINVSRELVSKVSRFE